ncbi:TonB-dependent receptor domain-containing protein [Sphingomonas aerophila]|uniref:Outer membrane receptor protein involved in Fe transport n=1 Tax=Sphingomonas aerophila TaxID=1344948 RepID=A0A7W9BDP6_9SPHN|nr:TonB-dependent receptor [Sphingomonas aerophila]MBB5715320.1 outer membrane receptor protein involved in Fe transport [Sphingomonas aerophila]
MRRSILCSTTGLTTLAFVGLMASTAPAYAQATDTSGQQSQIPSTSQQEGQQAGAAATTSTAPTETPAAAAQEGLGGQQVPADAGSDQEVVVTGSRIARPSVDNAQPTTTLSAATLNNRGYQDVARAINELPGFSVPDSSLVGGQGNGFGVGQSFVNLYALGSQRTLTLVNGRRFVGANPATVFSSAGAGTQVDLNTIPTKLIERVETVSIGGAPIYGADAIAGTVNIILRKDFSGIDLDGQAGISQQGDLGNQRIRGLFGTNFGDGRGNITVNVEYNHDAGLLGNRRDIVRRQLGFVAPGDPDSPFSQVLVGNTRTYLGTTGGVAFIRDAGRLVPAAPGGTTSVIRNAAGQIVAFDPSGNLTPFNIGTPTSDPTTFLGGDNLNFADITNLRVTDDRLNAVVLGHYDLTDGIEVFGEGWVSKNWATNLADQPNYNTSFFSQSAPGSFDVNGNFIFKLNNPFLTQQARDVIRANLAAAGLPSGDDANFYVGRANVDLTSGVSKLNQGTYRLVGGFRGDFQFNGHKWTWEASANYGRTNSRSVIPSIVEPNLRRALNVGRDASGNIVCLPFNPDPNDPTQPPLVRTDPNSPPFGQQYNGTISTTCAPLNLFGNGAPSQAARDYVTTNATTYAITSQRDFLATLTGSLLTLPGGDLGVSVGYENRREYSRFSPDAFYTTPLGRSIPINGLRGSYTTNEVFGEIRAPLIGRDQNIPLIEELEVNAAGRYVDNSAVGGAFTWTAGGRWAPISGVAVRGNFTKAIRAPAVTELFAANQPAFDGGFDPCDVQNVNGGPNPATRIANCTAAGLPPSAEFSSLVNSVSIPINVIGNRNLENETANSWTVGGVITPSFVRGFSLSVDYININLRNTIVSSSAEDVLRGCYDATTYPDNFYCGLVTRDTTPGENFGQVLTLDEPYINQGGQRFQALELEGGYRSRIGSLGTVNASVSYQHIIKQDSQISSDTPRTSTRGNIGSSVDKVNASVTLDTGPVSWFNQVVYTGPAKFDVEDAPNTRDVTGVGSFTVWNTALIMRASDRFDFRFNIDNVLAEKIPYPATAGSGALNTYYQGLVGRAFLVGAGFHF